MSCGVGCRCGSDPELLWLWRRPVAMAPIRLLAWETSTCRRGGLRNSKKTKKKKKSVDRRNPTQTILTWASEDPDFNLLHQGPLIGSQGDRAPYLQVLPFMKRADWGECPPLQPQDYDFINQAREPGETQPDPAIPCNTQSTANTQDRNLIGKHWENVP